MKKLKTHKAMRYSYSKWTVCGRYIGGFRSCDVKRGMVKAVWRDVTCRTCLRSREAAVGKRNAQDT